MPSSFELADQRTRGVAPSGSSAFDLAHQKTMAAAPKKEIPRPDPGLSLMERIVGGVDQGMQWLDRLHSATNAAANQFAQTAGQVLHSTPTPEQLQRQGAPTLQTIFQPTIQNVRGLINAVPQAVQAGEKAYQGNQKVGFSAYSQATPPNASTTEKIVRRALDLSSDIQTDPTQLLYAGAAGLAGKAIRATAKLPQAQKILQPVVNLTERALQTKPGALLTRIAGNVGLGPEQTFRRVVQAPYERNALLAEDQARKVVGEIDQLTTNLQKSDKTLNSAISDYAAQNKGANPIAEAIRDRALQIVKGQPFQGSRVGQAYGISDQGVEKYAQRIVGELRSAEQELAKIAPKRINPNGAEQRAVRWLDGLFGEAPAKRVATGQGPVDLKMVRETGLRNLVNNLQQDGTYIKPLGPNGEVTPGWVPAPSRGPLGSLAGNQIPEQLNSMLQVELAKSGMRRSDEAKSWYIKNKDLLEWAAKNGFGFIKRGLIGNPATQITNLASNNIVVDMGLKANGVSPKTLPDEVRKAMKELWVRGRTGKEVSDVEEFRKFSNAIDSTLVSTSLQTGGGQLGQVNKVANAGGVVPFVVPTPGKIAGSLYPPNQLVNFQGLAEQSYKLAMYRLLKPKIGAQAAAAQVDKYLFDYADRGPWLEVADKFGFWPFNAWPTKALGLVLDTVANHPEQLAKYPRLMQLAQQGYNTKKLENVDPRYRSAFMIPFGNPQSPQYLDVQRFLPFGPAAEAASEVGQGDLLGTAMSAMGLGRAGETGLEAAINAPLYSRLYGIAQGISPFSEAGKARGMLQQGQPPSDVRGLQEKELAKNFLPSLLGGRGYTAGKEAAQGITPTDYPFSIPRTPEEVALQYGLGLRTMKAETPTQKKKEYKGEAKARKTDEVTAFLAQAKKTASTSTEFPKDIQADADKLSDPGAIKAEIVAAKSRLKKLPISGRTVDSNGRMTDEGKRNIQRQLFYIYALKARLKEVVRGR